VTPVEVRLGEARVGTIYRHPASGGERVTFRYAEEWLASSERFAIDPELSLDARTTGPSRGGLFGALADCAPDRWGRALMQRYERLTAEAEGRTVRTLSEMDYLLGVSDRTRAGALRFVLDGRYVAEHSLVPMVTQLGKLLRAADRVTRDEATQGDLALILAPGSSLGGARPKASVVDPQGGLSIAKFPRDGDEYAVELWEYIALQLARAAKIRAADCELVRISGRHVLLSRRFDRVGERRVPFASALTLLGLRDGERASYPEIAEILLREGSEPRRDCEELFRRMVFNICISNLDDHLRNHGFLRAPRGWTLSPAYDLNPVPAEVRPRILTTYVTLDDATGTLEAARESATYFGLARRKAEAILTEVRAAVAAWEVVARAAGAKPRECARMRSAFLF
jgi:serine/threonine-protein kinase HipA